MLGFYIHDHGSGHLTRALKLLYHYSGPAVLFGTLSSTKNIEKIGRAHGLTYVHIPEGVRESNSGVGTNSRSRSSLYPSIHVQNINNATMKQRTRALVQGLVDHNIQYLVIDLSCEVAALANVLTIPYMYVRLQGDRFYDTPHRHAFQGADRLLCPFPTYLDTPNEYTAKTLHLRYERDNTTTNDNPDDNPEFIEASVDPAPYILVLAGKGNGGLNINTIARLGRALPHHTLHILGDLKGDGSGGSPLTDRSVADDAFPSNCTYHGFIKSTPRIVGAEIVIATCGNTIIQEMMAHSKNYIAIPERTYYDEQKTAALRLSEAGLATVVLSRDDTGAIVKAVETHSASRSASRDDQQLAHGKSGKKGGGGKSYAELMHAIEERYDELRRG